MGEEMLSEMEVQYEAWYQSKLKLHNQIIHHYKLGICTWQNSKDELIFVHEMTNSHIKASYDLVCKWIKNAKDDALALKPEAYACVFKWEMIKRKMIKPFNSGKL